MNEQLVGGVALRAFIIIFLAEMADKTQLMTIALAAHHRKPVLVFIGAITALAVVTAIGVIFGEAISRVIPARRMHQIAGIIFIALGVIMFIGRD